MSAEVAVVTEGDAGITVGGSPFADVPLEFLRLGSHDAEHLHATHPTTLHLGDAETRGRVPQVLDEPLHLHGGVVAGVDIQAVRFLQGNSPFQNYSIKGRVVPVL